MTRTWQSPKWLLICSAVVLILSSPAFQTVAADAQSVMIIGGSEAARECFRRAGFVVTTRSADDDDVAQCNAALESGGLGLRDRAATYVNRGILLLAAGNISGARASYDQALDLAPDLGEVYINIGNVCLLQQQYKLAIVQYTRGIPVMRRGLHVAYLNRGLAHEYLKDYPHAVDDYAKAVELAPGWLRAQKMLARAQAKLSP